MFATAYTRVILIDAFLFWCHDYLLIDFRFHRRRHATYRCPPLMLHSCYLRWCHASWLWFLSLSSLLLRCHDAFTFRHFSFSIFFAIFIAIFIIWCLLLIRCRYCLFIFAFFADAAIAFRRCHCWCFADADAAAAAIAAHADIADDADVSLFFFFSMLPLLPYFRCFHIFWLPFLCHYYADFFHCRFRFRCFHYFFSFFRHWCCFSLFRCRFFIRMLPCRWFSAAAAIDFRFLLSLYMLIFLIHIWATRITTRHRRHYGAFFAFRLIICLFSPLMLSILMLTCFHFCAMIRYHTAASCRIPQPFSDTAPAFFMLPARYYAAARIFRCFRRWLLLIFSFSMLPLFFWWFSRCRFDTLLIFRYAAWLLSPPLFFATTPRHTLFWLRHVFAFAAFASLITLSLFAVFFHFTPCHAAFHAAAFITLMLIIFFFAIMPPWRFADARRFRWFSFTPLCLAIRCHADDFRFRFLCLSSFTILPLLPHGLPLQLLFIIFHWFFADGTPCRCWLYWLRFLSFHDTLLMSCWCWYADCFSFSFSLLFAFFRWPPCRWCRFRWWCRHADYYATLLILRAIPAPLPPMLWCCCWCYAIMPLLDAFLRWFSLLIIFMIIDITPFSPHFSIFRFSSSPFSLSLCCHYAAVFAVDKIFIITVTSRRFVITPRTLLILLFRLPAFAIISSFVLPCCFFALCCCCCCLFATARADATRHYARWYYYYAYFRRLRHWLMFSCRATLPPYAAAFLRYFLSFFSCHYWFFRCFDDFRLLPLCHAFHYFHWYYQLRH